jgi:elongation factor G
MMQLAAARGVCRMIVINKIDADNVNLPALVGEIRERFGRECMLLDLPVKQGSEVVELLGHDERRERFRIGGCSAPRADRSDRRGRRGSARPLPRRRCRSEPRRTAPAFRESAACRPPDSDSLRFGKDRRRHPATARRSGQLAPSPAEGNPPPFYRGEPGGPGSVPGRPGPAEARSGARLQDRQRPFIGKVGVFRVHQGTIRKDSQLFVGDGKRPFKVGHIYRLQGKEYLEAESLVPGDLGAIAKVDEIEFDCVLHDSHDEDHIHLKPLEFPQPMQGLAVTAVRKADEQRLFEILRKLEVEDPCFKIERHPTTNETVIRGIGEMHLRAKLTRLAQQYKLELDTAAAADRLS